MLSCPHEGEMVLLHGFEKKSQKTPIYELDVAMRRLKGFEQVTSESEQGHPGASLESFLIEEGISEEATALAIKRMLAWQLREVMRQRIDLLEPHACNHSRMI